MGEGGEGLERATVGRAETRGEVGGGLVAPCHFDLCEKREPLHDGDLDVHGMET